MAVSRVRNVTAIPLSLPSPFRVVIPGGALVPVVGTVDEVVATLGGADFIDQMFDVVEGLDSELATAQLNMKTAVTDVKTANYTAVVGERVRVDPTGGSVTITLPAGSIGEITIENSSDSTNAIKIVPSGSNTINGSTMASIAVERGSLTFAWDNSSNWGID